jgi:hypothetical protein
MTFFSARAKFEGAKNAAQNPAITAIAEGLEELSRALEHEINGIERDLQTIKNRVNSIR